MTIYSDEAEWAKFYDPPTRHFEHEAGNLLITGAIHTNGDIEYKLHQRGCSVFERTWVDNYPIPEYMEHPFTNSPSVGLWYEPVGVPVFDY